MEITYTNDRNQAVGIRYSLPYFFQEIEGIDGLAADIEKFVAVGQDGTNISSVLLKDRPLRLSGAIKGKTREEIAAYRIKLLEVFNPKSNGTLIYNYGGVIRKIGCYVEKGPVFKKKSTSYRVQEFVIDIICPNPFFTDYYDTEVEVVSGASSFKFPVAISNSFKFGYFNRDGYVLNNDGDVPCPLEIIITGPQSSPLEIQNTVTGEKIIIGLDLTGDEELIISTAAENINVVKTLISTGETTSAFQYIDVEQTEFFDLEIGQNNIVITANGTDIGSAKIRYKNRYIGV